MKNYLFIGSLLLLVLSCTKDKKIAEEEIIEGIGWKAEQQVRILKVEQKQRLWAIPFKAAEKVEVKYFYDTEGAVSKITLSTLDNPFYSEFNWTKTDNEYFMTVNEVPEYYAPFILRNNQYKIDNNVIKTIKGNYAEWLIPAGWLFGDYYRNVNFEYSTEGLLSDYNSVFEYSDINEVDTSYYVQYNKTVGNLIYENNYVKSFQLINSAKEMLKEEIEGENYQVNVSYTSAKDVPDGLRRLVNQAILGLSPMGMEEIFNNPEYVNDSARAVTDPSVSSSVFADWIFSFACPQIQSIPAQGVGLVSQKHIIGKRMAYIDYTTEPAQMIYKEIDSTANFPYIHNASAKTLEIAGLKIYYELVE